MATKTTMNYTMQIDGNHYDGDILRSLADRDTPAALVAQAALDVADVEIDGPPNPSETPTVGAAGD